MSALLHTRRRDKLEALPRRLAVAVEERHPYEVDERAHRLAPVVARHAEASGVTGDVAPRPLAVP